MIKWLSRSCWVRSFYDLFVMDVMQSRDQPPAFSHSFCSLGLWMFCTEIGTNTDNNLSPDDGLGTSIAHHHSSRSDSKLSDSCDVESIQSEIVPVTRKSIVVTNPSVDIGGDSYAMLNDCCNPGHLAASEGGDDIRFNCKYIQNNLLSQNLTKVVWLKSWLKSCSAVSSSSSSRLIKNLKKIP